MPFFYELDFKLGFDNEIKTYPILSCSSSHFTDCPKRRANTWFDWPPYQLIDKKQPSGLDIEIITSVLKAMKPFSLRKISDSYF